MKKIPYVVLLLINLFWAVSYAGLQAGEGIYIDPATGNYLISYRDGAGTANDLLVQLPFTPSTKIDPILSSSTQMIDGWNIRYGYVLTNSTKSKQSIVAIRLFGLPVKTNIAGTTTTITEGSKQVDIFEPTLTVPNTDWYGSGSRVPIEQMLPNGSVNISWYCLYDSYENPDTLLGIHPGTALGGFSLVSSDLPGLFAVQVQGNGTGHIGFPGYAPGGDISDLIDQLQDNDFVSRNAAAPMIAVPTPFDPAVTLERIQDHMHTWTAKQLLDVAFSTQLDSFFQAAISAYRLNQPQVGKKQLEMMREFIKQQQPEAEKQVLSVNPIATPPAKIDLLAARILFFDLNYVMERGSK